LVVYDEHGGLYDHVIPPACTGDGFTAQPGDTGTGMPFAFDRLGVRVPAILISPYVPKGTVVDGRIFEHACIPNTITDFFLNGDAKRTDREAKSDTFLDLLSGPMRTDDDIPWFEIGN
jgi:phospholipase C